MEFKDLPTTKKGASGEEIVRPVLQGLGWTVPMSVKEKHWWDWTITKKHNNIVIAIEVKTKDHNRGYGHNGKLYNGAGIDTVHFEEYKRYQKLINYPFVILFVDESLGHMIYGNTLNELMATYYCQDDGITYPNQTHGGKITQLPLSKMRPDINRLEVWDKTQTPIRLIKDGWLVP